MGFGTGFGSRSYRESIRHLRIFSLPVKRSRKTKNVPGLTILLLCCFPVSFAPLVRRSTDRFDDRFPKMDNM